MVDKTVIPTLSSISFSTSFKLIFFSSIFLHSSSNNFDCTCPFNTFLTKVEKSVLYFRVDTGLHTQPGASSSTNG